MFFILRVYFGVNGILIFRHYIRIMTLLGLKNNVTYRIMFMVYVSRISEK